MSIMQMNVFAKKTHLPFITHVESEYTKTGFAGTYGNKGGTSVRFRLYDKTVAIVNCHLSAHMDQIEIRDEEYWTILSEQVPLYSLLFLDLVNTSLLFPPSLLSQRHLNGYTSKK